MEGSMVNLDVTAPGATLALALMFLKTNCKIVAARLAIPDTHFALEYVRPDFILLRVVARSLILWDRYLLALACCTNSEL
jgi:anaphase-promoting complex subunit 1